MEKKDIYEHLARIYLDASSKRRNKSQKKLAVLRSFLGLTLAGGIAVFLFINFFPQEKLRNSEIALLIYPDALKLNFNFNPAKKEVFCVNLNNLNMHRFRFLGFALKNAAYKDTISLRVEFMNTFKEKSEVYLKNISHNKWQDYRINLKEFKDISDWSQIQSLSFAVEEWNSRQDKGIVYIDNIRFLQ